MERTEQNMQPCQFNVGDRVVYAGLEAIVDRISPVFSYEYWLLSLTSVEDEEMTCTAKESECEQYNADAQYESLHIQMLGESLTDKNFRDGCH
jgi:hypothetical protein